MRKLKACPDTQYIFITVAEYHNWLNEEIEVMFCDNDIIKEGKEDEYCDKGEHSMRKTTRYKIYEVKEE